MQGKTALVTGATSGIGKETALALAKQGATVVLVARNQSKGQAVLEEIRSQTANPKLDLLIADLSSQASIRQLAAEFKSKYPRLEVLVNNAGGYFGSRKTTVDGLEYTFAFNHLAYFLLTNLLLDVLKAGAPSRVVNVSSGAQSMGRINFDDLQGHQRFSGQTAYNQSKLANVLFTYELARRLQGTGVSVNALHPGVVRTNFGQDELTPFFRLVLPLLKRFMLTPEKGAQTSIYLASSAEVEGLSGKYFVKQKAVPSAKSSYDTSIAQRLWRISEELTGFVSAPRA